MIRTVTRLLLLLTTIAIPNLAFGQAFDLQQWLQSRVKARKLDFEGIVEIKQWRHAPKRYTYIILAIGSKDVRPGEGFTTPRGQFGLVLLVQSARADILANPAELSFLNIGPVFPNPRTKEIPGVSIDLGPYPIREKEYAFGIRRKELNELGNRGGLAYEVLTLYRALDSESKEIFRDLTWMYSKYSEPGSRSCNVEAVIVPAPQREGEFFNVVRKPTRSYLGDARVYELQETRLELTETPVDSCSLIGDMQFPNTHRWDPARSTYVESGRSFLSNPDLWGKGIYIGRDR